MLKKILWVAVAAALAACGGSDPGTGTKTLHVTADMGSDGSPDGTYIIVHVRDGHANGATINDAVVLLTPEGGNELPVDFLIWRNFRNNFPWTKSYRLKVTRGSDRLEAVLSTPGLTTVTAPAGATVFDRAGGAPLRVTWEDSFQRRADTVEVELEDGRFSSGQANILVQGDNLLYDIPTTAWTQPTTSERVRITRAKSINLAGGAPGSVFTAETTHRSPDFTVN